MVKRVVLGRSGEERVVDLIKELSDRASAGGTAPGGSKVLEPGEDYYWSRPDGSSHSMREVDEGLAMAEVRIEDAEQSLADSQVRLDEAEQQIQTTQSGLDTLESETLPAAVEALEQADAAAQEQFDELDARLGDFATDEALAPIRQALSDAQAAVEAAQGVAQSANEAANAASQAALEAAGIAASKGSVLIQEDEPQGDDRRSSNIWIKPIPDDPDTEIEEKAITYVYLEESDEWITTSSDELAQAAQNALDAREAAQQATQRAETAISNAAAAQGAAEAAQRTADDATLEAREAHNEAVAAQAAADAAIERGDSLVLNGSFELDAPAWPAVANRYGVIEHAGARTGSRVMRLAPVSANAYPMSESFAVQAGQQIHAQMWYRYFPGDRDSRLSIYYQQRDNAGELVVSGYAQGSDGRSVLLRADDMVESEWALIEGTIPIEEGTTHLSVSPHALRSATDIFHIDDLLAVDVTEARKAQARADEAYAEAASKLDESQVDAKIATSANGKNSITRKTVAPTTSAADRGVVAGDAWYRVDGNGDAMGMWIWSGSAWVASKVRNEMIDTLDVNKVVGGSGDFETFFAENFTANDGVVEKLWTDQLVGKTATFNRLTIAPGNLWPDPYFQDQDMWPASGGGRVRFTSPSEVPNGSCIALSTAEDSSTYSYFGSANYRGVQVEAGAKYRLRFMARFGGSSALTHVRVYLRGDDSAGQTVTNTVNVHSTPGTSFQHGWLEAEITAPATLAGLATVGLWVPGTDTVSTVEISGFEMVRKAGAVLIEDGAITTPKLTVTEDMSAAIVNAMTTNTKKLVVTEEAILNHATLIGQTVVDDINVQGKLIGTDGVFTGTVDFENINVTGDLLASRISGEYLYGTEIEGGVFYTSGSSQGQVTLGDTAFTPQPLGGLRPGISVAPANHADFYRLPGLGPIEDGMQLSGGNRGARRTFADFTTAGMSVTWDDEGAGVYGRMSVGSGGIHLSHSGAERGSVRVDEEGVWLTSEAARLNVARNFARINAGDAGVSVNSGHSSNESAGVAMGGRYAGFTTSDSTRSVTLTGDLQVASGDMKLRGRVAFPDAPTTSSGANIRWQLGSGVFYVNKSSRRYKRNIADWSPSPEAVLGLRPRQWQHDDPNSDIDERWHVGFIAEEVHDLGLKGLVDYWHDGKDGWRPEALNYERFSAAQQVVLQKHERELGELRERIALLEAQIGTQ